MDVNGSISSKGRPESRLQKSMRGAMKWMLVALVAFGLGILLIILLLYAPTQQKLTQANAALVNANAMVSSQTEQITTLKTDNGALQKNLDSATLHVYVLKALTGVRAASLAVASNDYAGADLSLTQTSQALDILYGLLAADHKDVLNAIQKSAAQALTDAKVDLKSAQPELDQLTKNLAQLEDSLFTNH